MQSRSKWIMLSIAVLVTASSVAAAAPSARDSTGAMPANTAMGMRHGMTGGDAKGGGMMGGGMMGGGMMGGGMMGGGMMGMEHRCSTVGNGSIIPQLPPGNEKLQLKMQGEMMQKMGEILVRYADQIEIGKAGSH